MISRTSTTAFVRGPAIVTYNGSTFYSQDAIRVKTNVITFDVASAAKGNIDRRLDQILTEITFTPVGNVSSGDLANLFPHGTCTPGASAVPGTDTPLVVHPLNGKEKLTYKNAFVSKMPDLLLSAVKAPFGAVTFTAFGTNNEAWTGTEHFFEYAATAAFSDTSLAIAGIKTVPYTAVLGALSAPWNSIQTEEGFAVSFQTGLTPKKTDDNGIFDYLYTTEQSVSCRLQKPIGISVSDVHGLQLLQGSGAARGASILSKKQNLVLTGPVGATVLTMNNMLIQGPEHGYGKPDEDRFAALEFASVRNLTTGALDALFTIAVVAAP